ncbi:MAG: hypothetical protein ACXAC2_17735 [Candidatus Kariarchaeaceae archaeon]|jgi:hypothetical protein
MELETILNALEDSSVRMDEAELGTEEFERRLRQNQAFYCKILKMFRSREIVIRYKTNPELIAWIIREAGE